MVEPVDCDLGDKKTASVVPMKRVRHEHAWQTRDKTFDPSLAWVMVNDARATRTAAVERPGWSKRLAKNISRDFLGGRTWTVETIRREYKNGEQRCVIPITGRKKLRQTFS